MRYLAAAVFAASVLLGGCFAASPENNRVRVDEIPMYGEIDRAAVPELKAADDTFIAEVSKQYGSREEASRAWVDQGFSFYQRDDLAMAMKRFNQAWLLDPKNAEVYAGFGAILHDQGKNCEAMRMMEKALTLNPPTSQGIYPDAGRLFTLCAVSDQALTPANKATLLARSEALYRTAEEVERDKGYVYSSWSTSYYWQGRYADAWAMVAKERKAGSQPSGRFLELLRAKMPEPR